jgi:hypothetical protein
LLDLGITIFVLYHVKKLDERWYEMEANPIARLLWKKYGLKKGTILILIYILPLMILVGWIASLDKFLFGIVIGQFSIVFGLHLRMLLELRRTIWIKSNRLLLHKDNNRKV